MNEWMKACMDEWMHEWMNPCVSDWTYEQADVHGSVKTLAQTLLSILGWLWAWHACYLLVHMSVKAGLCIIDQQCACCHADLHCWRHLSRAHNWLFNQYTCCPGGQMGTNRQEFQWKHADQICFLHAKHSLRIMSLATRRHATMWIQSHWWLTCVVALDVLQVATPLPQRFYTHACVILTLIDHMFPPSILQWTSQLPEHMLPSCIRAYAL